LNNLKRLFPECKIKIHNKKPDESCKNLVFQESSTDIKQEKRKNIKDDTEKKDILPKL